MKLTATVVKQFERDQEEFGTQVALHNFVWNFAADVLKGLGVVSVSTTYAKRVQARGVKLYRSKA